MPRGNDLQPLLDVRQNQLSFQLSVSDSLDTKALAILGAVVAVLLYMAQAEIGASWWALTGCVVLYTCSIVLSIAGAWPRHYNGPGIDPANHPEYLSMEAEQLVLQLLADTQQAIDNNKLLNRSRVRLCLLSFFFAGLATIALLVILVV